MNSVRSNNSSLKYVRFAPSGCKDLGIIKFEFVVNTQILCVYVGSTKNLNVKTFDS